MNFHLLDFRPGKQYLLTGTMWSVPFRPREPP